MLFSVKLPGKLVATNRRGSRRGEVPNRFLDLAGYAKTSLLASYVHGAGSAQAIGELAPTIDNSQGGYIAVGPNCDPHPAIDACAQRFTLGGWTSDLSLIPINP